MTNPAIRESLLDPTIERQSSLTGVIEIAIDDQAVGNREARSNTPPDNFNETDLNLQAEADERFRLNDPNNNNQRSIHSQDNIIEHVNTASTRSLREYERHLGEQLHNAKEQHKAFEQEAQQHAETLQHLFEPLKAEEIQQMKKEDGNDQEPQPNKLGKGEIEQILTVHGQKPHSVDHKSISQAYQKSLRATLETPAATEDDDEGHGGHGGGATPVTITVEQALQGLSTSEILKLREKFGFNELVEKKQSHLVKFLLYFTGSIAYLIEAAVILSGVLEDWIDFGVILALLFCNAIIGFVEEARAESAIDALKNTLALTCRAIRDGKALEIEAREIVPGDIINIRLGDIIPADCQSLGINSSGQLTPNGLSVDQSSLTGESLPVHKRRGDPLMGSSIVKQGQGLALVTATGENSFIGRAAHLMSISKEAGHFQKLIAKIGNLLIAVTLIMVFILIFVTIFAMDRDPLDSIQYALVLIIASIPVGLPTVMSVTMAVGAKQLAKKKCVVKKLQAVEQMASIDILCSDKTGTLTLNKLSLDEPWLSSGKTNEDLLMAAFLASEGGAADAIEMCIREVACATVPELKNVDPKQAAATDDYSQLSFHPFDPVSKMTKAVVLHKDTIICVAKGAPQVILQMCGAESIETKTAVAKMARSGLRALGVARSKPIEASSLNKKLLSDASKNHPIIEWELVGLLSLLDPPRVDSASTIKKCHEYGISVKMITGDALLIAKEVSRRLGIHRNILPPQRLAQGGSEEEIALRVEKCDGFAQVVPEDKYRVVELLQQLGHRTAMTGDGVNDSPALKKADVGIAVHGASDAARSAASIVLMEPGLSAIVDAILTSRAIFQRMRSYALYRITSTIHFLIFLFFAIIFFNFFIPPVLIVFITLLNDAATVVISWDNALINKKPDKWRLGQVIFMSTIMGVLLAGWSFAHYTIGRYVIGSDDDVMGTVMYLQLSSSPHFVIFSTRVEDYFWKNHPSLIFFIAIFGTQVFAMFISIYGAVSTECGWPWGIVVMCTSLLFFMFLDIIKVQIYRRWSYEFTVKLWPTPARKLKLQIRKQRQAVKERVQRNFQKIQRLLPWMKFAMQIPSFQPHPSNSLRIVIEKMH